jgi:hypothetical protein
VVIPAAAYFFKPSPRKPGALSAKEKRTIREWIVAGARGMQ